MSPQSHKARVRNGRLVLDEPTGLPEGKVVELTASVDDEMNEADLAKLDAELQKSVEAEKADQVRPAREVLAELRARR